MGGSSCGVQGWLGLPKSFWEVLCGLGIFLFFFFNLWHKFIVLLGACLPTVCLVQKSKFFWILQDPLPFLSPLSLESHPPEFLGTPHSFGVLSHTYSFSGMFPPQFFRNLSPQLFMDRLLQCGTNTLLPVFRDPFSLSSLGTPSPFFPSFKGPPFPPFLWGLPPQFF